MVVQWRTLQVFEHGWPETPDNLVIKIRINKCDICPITCLCSLINFITNTYTHKKGIYWLLQVKSLLLSCFSRVRLCATRQTAAHQAPPSLGFSRQEYWSGLPCPSPMHESEKWKWGRSVVSDSSRPHGLEPTRLLRPWDFTGKRTGVGCHRLLRKSLEKC